ncbi:MAG: sulfotransferase [Rubrobacter sp.]
MGLPNFLLIGAQKAGTTALYHYLGQHPQVYMSPVKEPHFFAYEGEELDYRGPRDREILPRMVVTDLEAYRELFRGAAGEKALGEASAGYLYDPKAPGRIRRYAPDARLIAVLRDPAERAYSSFLHMVRDGREPLNDFEQALREEETRIRDNWSSIWHYKRAGFYVPQLTRYFEMFGRERVRVYLYEDLKEDPAGVVRDAFGHLGVDEGFVPDVSLRHNVSGVPKSRVLHGFLGSSHPVKSAIKPFVPEAARLRLVTLMRNRNLSKPSPLSPEVRGRLVEEYREDVLRLQDLIQRDLSRWLDGGGIEG